MTNFDFLKNDKKFDGFAYETELLGGNKNVALY